MPPDPQRTATQATLESPPHTAFNLKALLNSFTTTLATPRTDKNTSTHEYLLWLNNTPLLIEHQSHTDPTKVTAFTATAIDTKTTESDIENLLWGYLSEHIFITDQERINSEVKQTAPILAQAHTHTTTAHNTIDTAINYIDTITENDQDTSIHITIEKLTDHLETVKTELEHTEQELDRFIGKLVDNDVKQSSYNDTATVIANNCSQTISIIDDICAETTTITPNHLTQSLNGIQSRLENAQPHTTQLKTRINGLHEACTGNTIPDQNQSID